MRLRRFIAAVRSLTLDDWLHLMAAAGFAAALGLFYYWVLG